MNGNNDDLQSMIEKYKREMMRYSASRAATERKPQPEPKPIESTPPVDQPEPPQPVEIAPPSSQPEIIQPEPLDDPEPVTAPPPVITTRPYGSAEGTGDPIDDTGRMRVRVVTGDSSVPLPSASVVVTRQTPDGEELIRILTTDNDGLTPEIELPTYNRLESESPDNEGAKFTIYNIYTEYSGYLPAKSIGVPIFGGVTSVQTFEMVPTPEFYSGDSVSTAENSEPQDL